MNIHSCSCFHALVAFHCPCSILDPWYWREGCHIKSVKESGALFAVLSLQPLPLPSKLVMQLFDCVRPFPVGSGASVGLCRQTYDDQNKCVRATLLFQSQQSWWCTTRCGRTLPSQLLFSTSCAGWVNKHSICGYFSGVIYNCSRYLSSSVCPFFFHTLYVSMTTEWSIGQVTCPACAAYRD